MTELQWTPEESLSVLLKAVVAGMGRAGGRVELVGSGGLEVSASVEDVVMDPYARKSEIGEVVRLRIEGPDRDFVTELSSPKYRKGVLDDRLLAEELNYLAAQMAEGLVGGLTHNARLAEERLEGLRAAAEGIPQAEEEVRQAKAYSVWLVGLQIPVVAEATL